MDAFWFIPLLIVVLIGTWAFYHKVIREGGRGERHEGKVLVDKPDPPDL